MSTATHSTTELVRQRFEGIPVGEPFASASFLDCGTRASVDQALSRLAKAGIIERVARGVFVRPEVSRFVGKVMPEPGKVVRAIAKSTGSIVQVHGSEAARQFGLSTQVSMQPVFSTSGPSRRVRVGAMEIRMIHTSPGKLVLAERPAGLALSALLYLGKEGVTPEVVDKIRHKLAREEFEALKSCRKPSWLSDIFIRLLGSQGAHA